MKSHFSKTSSAAVACAVASAAATMLNGRCAAQPLVAADYATNSIYNSGWMAGQNGGYGFGPWSFNATDPAGSPFQSMSTASALGTAWTMFTTNQPDASNPSSIGGLANAGRAILEPGGLQVGQTFQAIIQNPINNPGIYTYRGFDILFTGGTDNDVGGDNTSALRLSVFDYFNPAMNWAISDAASPPRSSVSAMTTGASGMIISLTLNSTNTYTFTMAPVSNPTNPYLTYSGTLVAANLPITYFNFRNWNSPNPTGDTNDVADNFQISSMSILGVQPPTLNIQAAGTNLVLSWSTNIQNSVLESSPSLTNSAWNTNLPAPVVVGDQNVVTNPISGPQQFYRLQLIQSQ